MTQLTFCFLFDTAALKSRRKMHLELKHTIQPHFKEKAYLR